MSLLGIDVGTTGCKVIAFNIEGQILAQAYDEYPLLHSQPGWAELDSYVVWEKISGCIQSVAQHTKSDPVEAISVASQGEAVTPISKSGEILANTITSFDSRTTGISNEIGKEVSKLDLMKITGIPLSDITTLAKIIWIQQYQPNVFEQTWKFLGYEDFVFYKLGMPPVIDYSLAARTMLFDVIQKDWSEQMLNMINVDSSMFASPAASGTIIGEIGSDIAKDLGLPKNVVGVTGGHDQPCGALGAGIIDEGDVMDATGTVECIVPAFTTPVLNQRMIDGNFSCYPHVVDDMYVTLGFVSSGGVILRWFRDNFAQYEVEQAASSGQDVYDLLVESMSEEPSPVMLLPHFNGSGTPKMDLESKGAILGLTLGTSKSDMVKSILEGISFEIKHNLTLLDSAGVTINEIRAIGGGAKSNQWLQLKADIFGKKVIALDVSEGVCLGTAILAGTAIGKYPSIRSAVDQLVRIKEVYYPREEVQKKYEERMQVYSQIYAATQSIHHQL